MDFIHYTLS